MKASLDSDVKYVKGVGPQRAKLLNKLGIHTVRDLLFYFPREHLDRTRIKKISELTPGERTTITGKVLSGTLRLSTTGIKIFDLAVTDGTGVIWATFFNQPYLKDTFKKGDAVVLSGEVRSMYFHAKGRSGMREGMWQLKGHLDALREGTLSRRKADDVRQNVFGRGINEKYRSRQNGSLFIEMNRKHPCEWLEFQMTSPEFEIIPREDYDPIHTVGIIPRYDLTEGLKEKGFRRIVRNALDGFTELVQEYLPEAILTKRKFPAIQEGLRDFHFPPTMVARDAARARFAYEELFLLQVALAMKRAGIRRERKERPLVISDTLDSRIKALFPFELTADQKKVISEIRQDLTSVRPMNRLLHGDVGSGKTAVAAYALLAAVGNYRQAAVMAPTEILAEQHFQTFSRLLAHSKVRIALFTSGGTSRERRERLERLASGEIDLAIGTHALFQKDVQFKDLAVVVIDEQHKFGVVQRQDIRRKGLNPDVLVMSATPIPRSLALTLFGDLDISVLKQMPPGRRQVKTLWVPRSKRREAFEFIRKEIKNGRQAYFVYPLIEESETLALRSATLMYERLSREIYPDLRIGLVHGRMKQDEKDRIMEHFRNREIDILVSTIVIEVGIDVPNASVMVIEHAERFGLAQLHQMRGRIGRGQFDSYCILFADPTTEESRRRLDVMVSTSDGFKIAEEDMKIRGWGDFFGVRQSGFLKFKIANPVEDTELLKKAREDAFALVESDRWLEAPAHALLKTAVLAKFKAGFELAQVG